MLNVIMYPVVALYVVLGAGSSIVMVGYMLMVLAEKIFRKFRYGASLYA